MNDNGIGKLLSRFHHIGVVVKNLHEAAAYYENLGIGPFETSNLTHIDRKVYGESAPDVKLAAKGTTLGPMGFEIVQPVSGETPQKKFLEGCGEGINHIGFIVDDIDEAMSIMAKAGFKAISSAKNKGGGGMAFFDTDKTGGVQIELEELPPHLKDDPYWGLKPWSK